MAVREGQEHLWDLDETIGHHQAGKSAGGKCLLAHADGSVSRQENKSCGYRWQAYLKMWDDPDLYNWPRYESLINRSSRIKTIAQKLEGKIIPSWYRLSLTVPKEGEWDIGEQIYIERLGWTENFWDVCYVPWWHEAHHVVPNGSLNNAIGDINDPNSGLISVKIRKGLLKEKYNLNYKNNMIMLPMDYEVSKAMKLPRHRKSQWIRGHYAYSKKITSKLSPIFQKLKQKIKHHKSVKYANVKRQIVNVSNTMYDQIKESEKSALDYM